MASDDPSSFSFIVRLVHLSIYTLVELSFGITQLLRTSAAIDTMLVPEVASRLRDDPLTQSLVHQVGVFHVFVGLIAYMLRDEILDQRASARPFYTGMVCLQFALLRVTWQAEQAGLMNEHGTTTATCIAAIFGGGAAVALTLHARACQRERLMHSATSAAASALQPLTHPPPSPPTHSPTPHSPAHRTPPPRPPRCRRPHRLPPHRRQDLCHSLPRRRDAHDRHPRPAALAARRSASDALADDNIASTHASSPNNSAALATTAARFDPSAS